jgi:hypothetical protein
VIDVNVRQHERLNTIEWKLDLRARKPSSISTLKRPTIDQDRIVVVVVQLVTRTGNALVTAMMRDVHVYGISSMEGLMEG